MTYENFVQYQPKITEVGSKTSSQVLETVLNDSQRSNCGTITGLLPEFMIPQMNLALGQESETSPILTHLKYMFGEMAGSPSSVLSPENFRVWSETDRSGQSVLIFYRIYPPEVQRPILTEGLRTGRGVLGSLYYLNQLRPGENLPPRHYLGTPYSRMMAESRPKIFETVLREGKAPALVFRVNISDTKTFPIGFAHDTQSGVEKGVAAEEVAIDKKCVQTWQSAYREIRERAIPAYEAIAAFAQHVPELLTSKPNLEQQVETLLSILNQADLYEIAKIETQFIDEFLARHFPDYDQMMLMKIFTSLDQSKTNLIDNSFRTTIERIKATFNETMADLFIAEFALLFPLLVQVHCVKDDRLNLFQADESVNIQGLWKAAALNTLRKQHPLMMEADYRLAFDYQAKARYKSIGPIITRWRLSPTMEFGMVPGMDGVTATRAEFDLKTLVVTDFEEPVRLLDEPVPILKQKKHD